ncbi:MAG TPA: sulfotransferase [Chthoniobacterales bacterium]|nr:sulfotransferase [Chthoniobacterales bacterium]
MPDSSIHNQPIFIVGSPRSGTSILTWSLGQHPNLLGLEESNWMTSFAVDTAVAFRRGSARGERSQFSSMGMQRDQFMRDIGACINESIRSHRHIFEDRLTQLATPGGPEDHAAFKITRDQSDPKSRWVNGTPGYSFGITGLRKLFPAARFIHLVRDCDLVVASMLNFDRVAGTRLVETEEEGYRRWLACVRACVAAENAFGAEVVCRIFHEDLAGEPETAIRKILDFIGEPFASSCLEPLTKRINSSKVETGETKREPPAHPALIHEARELWRTLKENPSPARPIAEAATLAEEQFERRVKYIHELDAQCSRTQRAHKKLRDEFTERTEWALRLSKENAEMRKQIVGLQEEFSERTKWALSLADEVAQKDVQILRLQREFEKRTG